MSEQPRYAQYISTDLRRFMYAGIGGLARIALSPGREPEYYRGIVENACHDGYVRVARWWLNESSSSGSSVTNIAINQSNLPLLRMLVKYRYVFFKYARLKDAAWLWANAIQTGDIAIFECLMASGLGHLEDYFPSDLSHTTYTGTIARSLNPYMVTKVLTLLKHKGSIHALAIFAQVANAANLARYLSCVASLDEIWDITVSQSIVCNKDLDAIRLGLEAVTKLYNFDQPGTASTMSGSLGGALLSDDEPRLALLREFGLLDYAAYTNMREMMIELNRTWNRAVA